MQVAISFILSALMVIGGLVYTKEHSAPPLGASQTISALTAGTSLDDADVFPYTETSSLTTKKISWANATSSLQTWYDGRYQTVLTNSAGLRGALSDETGSGLAVFGTTPTLTTPILNSATVTTPYINVSGTEAVGDLLYLSDNGGTLSRLGIGSAGNLLTVSSGIPAWTDTSSSASTFGFLRTTGLLSIASSTIYGLTIGDSLPATTTDNLLVENNASTTNLRVSRAVNFSQGSSFNGFASSTSYEIVTASAAGPATTGSETSVTVDCTAGKVAIGGGAYGTNSNDNTSVRASYPYDRDTWYVEYTAAANGSGNTISAYAICVNL